MSAIPRIRDGYRPLGAVKGFVLDQKSHPLVVPGKVLLEVILGKQLGVQRLLERRHLIGIGCGGKPRRVDARSLGSLFNFNVGVIILVVVVGVLGLGWGGGMGREE